MSNEFKLVPVELLKSALGAVEYLALRGDDIGTSNVPVADALRELLIAAPQPPALGGELEARQAFDDWFRKDLGLPECANTTFIGAAREPWRAWQACSAVYRVHLAPLQAEIERLEKQASYNQDNALRWLEERDQLKAQRDDMQTFDIDAASRKLAECMDYPWAHMTERGHDSLRAHAKAVIDAALSKPAGSEKV